VASHKLSIYKEARYVSQKKCKLGEERRQAAKVEADKLLSAGFIEEAQYTTWLSNIVLVKKANGKWRMCVDYTGLKRVCPRDAYPLPNIDRLVDGAAGNKVLSFLDAYFGYNQIPMASSDMHKTAFIMDDANYFYRVMPFSLKNVGATYQRLMDKVFSHLMGHCVEVYIDDMVVKSPSHRQHAEDLSAVFSALRRYNLRLNLNKFVFGVDRGKFLGFMLTQRGIEANPEKCKAIIEMRSPTTVKEVQRLIGRLTAISRFLPKLAEQTQPIIQLLKKSTRFTWTDDCEQIFQKLKTTLTSPPILHKPDTHQPLLVYITATDCTVNAALVQEIEGTQHPVYFVSRMLQDPETRYQMVEKLAISLVHSARRLRSYFQNHTITVKTDYPIQKILQKPNLAGRMSSWTVKLSEFNIRYEPYGSIKAQCLLDFVNDLQQTPIEDQWTLHVDGSTNLRGVGAGIVLEGPNDIFIEKFLHFAFKTSNNQAEYEAIFASLSLTREVGIKRLTCKTDSKLTVGHLNDEFQIKDPILLQYYHLVCAVIQSAFEQVRIEHIPRTDNIRVDILSKLASTKLKNRHRSLLQQTLSTPSITHTCQNLTDSPADNVTPSQSQNWTTPYIQYLKTSNPLDADKTWLAKVARYTMIGDDLYKCGYGQPLLKCVMAEQAQYIIKELHEGICGYHSGARTMATRVLRAGYFWPTIEADCEDYVKKCKPCQKHGNLIHQKQE